MQHLNQPIHINGMNVSNRLVMPPMATAKSTESGQVSDALCRYYQDRSGEYIGLIITEHSYICPQGKAHPSQLSIANDQDVTGLEKLVSSIHSGGTEAMAQLNHAGSAASAEVTGFEPVAPSRMIHPRQKQGASYPHELSKGEILEIVSLFAQAAKRAKHAGYDGVEIHAAHGYLLNQFYSPLTNKRTDEYGIDCMENRVRLHIEIINAVREAVGKEYPIAIRLGGCDYCSGGSTIEDSVEASLLFERAGVDLLDISGGMNGYMVPGRNEAGYFSDMTFAVKNAVSIPVLLTGGIVTRSDAEQLLAEDKADMIGVGRALLKDPLWAEKALKPI